MANYCFVTNWTFEAPLEEVWEEIHRPGSWPEWWKSVVSTDELAPGDNAGMGAVWRYTWRGRLPYTLTFEMRTTLVEKFARLEGKASGELAGRGVWQFTRAGAQTRVRYDWEVEATKWWMRLLSPIARPLFEWNHDFVMRDGYQGLAQRLAAHGKPRTP